METLWLFGILAIEVFEGETVLVSSFCILDISLSKRQDGVLARVVSLSLKNGLRCYKS